MKFSSVISTSVHLDFLPLSPILLPLTSEKVSLIASPLSIVLNNETRDGLQRFLVCGAFRCNRNSTLLIELE